MPFSLLHPYIPSDQYLLDQVLLVDEQVMPEVRQRWQPERGQVAKEVESPSLMLGA